MRLALITERVPASPWHPEHLGVQVAGMLAQRGHTLEIICEAVEGDLALGPRVSMHARRGFCHRSSVRPWALRDHASQHLRKLRPSAALSLTRLVSAPVWMPIVASASAIAGRFWRLRGFEPRFREARALPLTIGKLLAESAARGDHYNVKRLLAFGPRAAESARTELSTLRDRVADVGFLQAVTPPVEPVRTALRLRVRQALGIAPDRVAVLVSSPTGMQKDLTPLIESAAHLHRQAGARAPVLMIAAMDAYAVHDAAVRIGGAPVVRLTGTTHQPEALLSAADAVAAWARGPGDAFAAGSASRLIVDALAFGLPVLALRAAPGAELIGNVREVRAPGDTRAVGPGFLVESGGSLAWYIALQSMLDPVSRAEVQAAARKRAEDLALTPALPRIIDRIEQELVSVAQAAPTRTAAAPIPTSTPTAGVDSRTAPLQSTPASPAPAEPTITTPPTAS